ncbi:hypothetical protein [Mucilaginibacter ginsenosidivorans]|uniref:Uncharacterized protein n=1 Tax=Mucilaginibacter ginsenosidivorans TaxID=398053 RepID=A0A5B8V1S8_9SPHI|nr:hypothetical protein [Mucilaginibacter ginsenosidivorans]QEC65334.1 hypothetical protein FRZ54_23095 [Mucilaginibacter ginsenosidivorans]
MSDWISHIVTNTIFLTWIGALCGHILSLYSHDFAGAKPFLEKIFPDHSNKFYDRLELIIVPVIGALLAFVLLDPTNLKSSIFAGLSWSGTLSSLLKRNSKNTSKDVDQ